MNVRPEETALTVDDVEPHLTRPVLRRPRAIVLFLHGGQPDSHLQVGRLDPAVLRMVPFAGDVEVRSRGRVGAALLRNSVRGWNGEEASSVADARWALERLAEDYPGIPIGLVGHSMGGRTAFALAGHPNVASIAALAPWKSEVYDAAPFVGTPLLVAHGQRDHLTDARTARALVERVQAAGGEATFVDMPGGHTMMWAAPRWHRLASQFSIQSLLGSFRRGPVSP